MPMRVDNQLVLVHKGVIPDHVSTVETDLGVLMSGN